MPSALDSYAEYARLIFFLLADRPTIEHHSLAVYTTSLSFTRPNLPTLIEEIEQFHA
jgi:hypothetical protein